MFSPSKLQRILKMQSKMRRKINQLKPVQNLHRLEVVDKGKLKNFKEKPGRHKRDQNKNS